MMNLINHLISQQLVQATLNFQHRILLQHPQSVAPKPCQLFRIQFDQNKNLVYCLLYQLKQFGLYQLQLTVVQLLEIASNDNSELSCLGLLNLEEQPYKPAIPGFTS